MLIRLFRKILGRDRRKTLMAPHHSTVRCDRPLDYTTWPNRMPKGRFVDQISSTR
jgi:hypothetical protein